MTKSSKTLVSGVFSSKENISDIVNYLENKGVSENDISILMSEEQKKHQFAVDTRTKAPEKAFKGLIIGSILGAVIGGLSIVGAIMIPGGLVIAGPVIGLIAGVTLGGIIGTVIGSLVGIKIPMYEAKFYENAANDKGNVLLIAHVNKDMKADIRQYFNKLGALNTTTR